MLRGILPEGGTGDHRWDLSRPPPVFPRSPHPPQPPQSDSDVAGEEEALVCVPVTCTDWGVRST